MPKPLFLNPFCLNPFRLNPFHLSPLCLNPFHLNPKHISPIPISPFCLIPTRLVSHLNRRNIVQFIPNYSKLYTHKTKFNNWNSFTALFTVTTVDPKTSVIMRLQCTTGIWLAGARFQQLQFISIHRDVMFASVQRKMPELYPFVYMCFNNASLLRVRGTCTTGRSAWSSPLLCFDYGSCEQHDVRAGYLVSGWRHNRWTTSWSASRSRYRTTHWTNTWMQFNEDKCEIVTNNEDVASSFRAVMPKIWHSSCSDALLLGAPIGNISEIDTALTNKLTDFQRRASCPYNPRSSRLMIHYFY